MLDVALSHLLEARHVNFSEEETSNLIDNLEEKLHSKPSQRVVEMYSEQLCTLLKTMLTTSQQMLKSSSQKTQTTRNPVVNESSGMKNEWQKIGQGGDVEKLKTMYRLALKSGKVPDVKGLYELWVT